MADAKGKRPSMFEVAKLAGVSHQTVSRVINHSPDVSAQTRHKVEEAIRVLGYRPSNSARALASSRSRTIGLIAGGFRFFGPISTISSIESIARSHGLFISVAMVHEALCSRSDFEELCEMFDQQNVDAFIFLTPTDAMFEAACHANVSQPRVFITSTHGLLSIAEGRSIMYDDSASKVSMVGVDQWNAVAEVVRMVADFGHRHVLYMAGPTDWRDATTRLQAWNQLSVQYSIQTQVEYCNSWESSQAYARMNHVLEHWGSAGASLPTAVVTANDSQAVGVVRALHEHRLRIPQDISVIGFDDMPGMDNLFPPLTTVRPDFEALGTAAMRETLRLLSGRADLSLVSSWHRVGLVPAQVMKRSSLGPARGARR